MHTLLAQVEAASAAAEGIPPLIAVPALLGLAALLWLFRAAMTPALGQAVVLAVASVAVLLGLGADPLDPDRRAETILAFAGLALLWLLAGRVEPTGVAAGLGYCCWTLAAGLLACADAEQPRLIWSLALLAAPAVIALLAGRVLAGAIGLLVICAIRPALVASLVSSVLPPETLAPSALLFGGGLALLATIGLAMRRFLLRRRVWLSEPARLLESNAPSAAATWTITVLAVVVAVAAIVQERSTLAGLAVLAAAIAVLGIWHMRGSQPGAPIGLLLLAWALHLLGAAWVPAMPPYALAGLVGGYMIWLALFWNQQLLAGAAWTTTGRLTDAARRIAWALAAVCVIAAARGTTWSGFWALIPFAFALLLLRDAFSGLSATSAAFGLIAAAGAALGVAPLGQAGSPLLTPFALLAAVGSLVAFRLSVAARENTSVAVALLLTLPPAVILLRALNGNLDASAGLAAVFWAAAVSVLAWPKREAPGASR